MRILSAALAAAIATTTPWLVSAGKEFHQTDESTENVPQVTDGFSAGTCLNERFQITNPGSTLTCNPTFTHGGGMGKFWTQIALKAPATCVEGQTLTVEDLVFESLFDMDARDFAVSRYENGVLLTTTVFILCYTFHNSTSLITSSLLSTHVVIQRYSFTPVTTLPMPILHPSRPLTRPSMASAVSSSRLLPTMMMRPTR